MYIDHDHLGQCANPVVLNDEGGNDRLIVMMYRECIVQSWFNQTEILASLGWRTARDASIKLGESWKSQLSWACESVSSRCLYSTLSAGLQPKTMLVNKNRFEAKHPIKTV